MAENPLHVNHIRQLLAASDSDDPRVLDWTCDVHPCSETPRYFTISVDITTNDVVTSCYCQAHEPQVVMPDASDN